VKQAAFESQHQGVSTMDYVILVGLITILAVLIYLAVGIQRLVSLLEELSPDWFFVSSRVAMSNRGYCIWTYRKGNWNLEKQYCAPGQKPGPPPQKKGAYEGECIRVECS